MQKNKVNIWKLIAIIIAALLLLYWLFAATLINEDENINEMQSLTVGQAD